MVACCLIKHRAMKPYRRVDNKMLSSKPPGILQLPYSPWKKMVDVKQPVLTLWASEICLSPAWNRTLISWSYSLWLRQYTDFGGPATTDK
jgi:hypothetical protein